jgi:hypothetical protein
MATRLPHAQREFEILTRLRDLGFKVERGKKLGGYEPDFVFRTDDGKTVVLEVKGWRPTEEHVQRAVSQVDLYQKALGADAGFVVLPGLKDGRPEDGVLRVEDLHLLPTLLARSTRAPGSTSKPSIEKDAPKRFVFAAMPFAPEFDDVFFVAMTHAAETVGATCKRIDKEDFSGDIVAELKSLIRSSVAIVADLSGSRPNVLYELGYADALPRPTVHICSTPLNELPFDVRNWNVLQYVAGRTHSLREPLAKRLSAVL